MTVVDLNNIKAHGSVFSHMVPFILILSTLCIWEQCTHTHTHIVSDVGDVKGEIAFLGPLLHFKGLARGLCDVCFARIASCFPGISVLYDEISLDVIYLLKNKTVLRALTVD